MKYFDALKCMDRNNVKHCERQLHECFGNWAEIMKSRGFRVLSYKRVCFPFQFSVKYSNVIK